MRQVGTLPNEQQARRFTDFLTTLDIDARPELDGEEWIIWVLDEERVAQAQEEYREFLAHPEEERYTSAAGKAEAVRREKAERQRAAAANVVEMRGQWKRGMARKAPLTFLLIAVCVAVFVLTHMVSPPSLGPGIDKATSEFPYVRTTTFRLLSFRDQFSPASESADPSPFRDIKRGQIWRLFTTMLLHVNVWHVFFNMYMLYYLGAQFEDRKGWVRFLLFVLLAEVFSAIVQVLISGPNLAGMSGVNYALFGFIWMQSRYLPKSGFQLSQLTVIILIGWFFACFTGWLGPIANAAHGAGLFFGVAIGYLPVMFPALEEKI